MWFSILQQVSLQCLLIISLIQGNGNRACPVRVIYPRSTLHLTVGDSLTLNCTVEFCTREEQKPVVYWCIIEARSCHPVSTNGLSFNHDQQGNLLVSYKIAALNYNDSGTFRCEASQGNVMARGHSIVVNVTEASDSPLIPVEHTETTNKWYFMSILPLSVVIVCIMLYCQGKQKLALRRQRAQVKSVTLASSSPNITAVIPQLSSLTGTTERHVVEAYVNIKHMEPFYVNETFSINEQYEECIYENDPPNQ
ncbi:uncharacterized protein LOC132829805 [Hemiscyllium ocellatum]|uniref:uncharacterized protein LOC132829805 n=1 Tax=Hemiscyllium ocellatum TaxID=170820 RepID=UPI0029675A62|nr:uncharacterized protein LOC132829805 [Hemiscyllium ocellatum]